MLYQTEFKRFKQKRKSTAHALVPKTVVFHLKVFQPGVFSGAFESFSFVEKFLPNVASRSRKQDKSPSAMERWY